MSNKLFSYFRIPENSVRHFREQYQRSEQEALRRASRALSPDERDSYEKIARSGVAWLPQGSEPERE